MISLRVRLAAAFGCDLRSLAALRIALGVLLLADLAWRLPLFAWCFTEDGAWPVAAAREGARLPWSLYLLSGATPWTVTLFAFAALAAIALILGWRTRIATIVAWVLLVSLQQRNTLVLNGGDWVLRLLLFWGAFLPLGAKCSLDARRKPVAAEFVTSGATIALLVQVAMIYVFNALYKVQPAWHGDGNALESTLQLETYATPFGEWLLAFPGLLRFATKAVWWLELLGPFVAFLPWRNAIARCVAACMFIGFHVLLLATVRIGIFPIICMTAWLPFLPGEIWERVGLGKKHEADAWPMPRWWGHGAPLIVLAYVLVWNVWDFLADRHAIVRPPDAFTRAGHALMLHQQWKLFSPPLSFEGWYVIAVDDGDGNVFDVFTNEKLDPAKLRPKHLRERAHDARFRKFLKSFRTSAAKDRIRWLAAWAEREWKRTHPDAGIKTLSIHFLWEWVAKRQSPPGNWVLYENPPGSVTGETDPQRSDPRLPDENSDN